MGSGDASLLPLGFGEYLLLGEMGGGVSWTLAVGEDGEKGGEEGGELVEE